MDDKLFDYFDNFSTSLYNEIEKLTKENKEIQEALNLLKDFCVKKGYDLSELFGPSLTTKKLREMSSEEIKQVNNNINERQKTRKVFLLNLFFSPPLNK